MSSKKERNVYLLPSETYGPTQLISAELYRFERILKLAYQCTKKKGEIIMSPEGQGWDRI